MIYITDQYGMSVESTRCTEEKTLIARTLLRRINNSILRDVYNPQANKIKRAIDALLRDIDNDRYEGRVE